MRSFAEKQNRPQRPASSNLTRSHGATPGLSGHPDFIPHLQRMLGNQAVQTILHTHTQELDAGLTGTASLQRSRSEQNRSGDFGNTAVPPIVNDVVHSSGIPLDSAVRTGAEARMGFDFSRVRVHADEAAARSADAVQARAYTLGSHIVFARGEYQPQTQEGVRVVMHELVHVAQQGSAAESAPAPRSTTQPHDASEHEAHAIAGRYVDNAARPQTLARLEPVVARIPKDAGKLQEDRSEALRHGLNPDEPVNKPVDPLIKILKEVTLNPPTIPDSWSQQEDAIPYVDPKDLWLLPRIHDRIEAIAKETEDRERAGLRPGSKIVHTAKDMMDYWQSHFTDSVDYILYRRSGDHREALLKKLHAQEQKLIQSAPVDLIEQVENVRHTLKDEWQAEVERAADHFVTIASNESLFITVKQAAKPVSVKGLPEYCEGFVEAREAPGAVVSTSKPVSPSVVDFIREVQAQSGLKALADNYARHEEHNPYVGDIDQIGKYSFDVDLGGLISVNQEGFYEREPLIKFFLAVDRAAQATDIAWVAIYNDFEVAKTVNEKLGKMHIGFSGGGSAGTGNKGSIHHGPAPYILHIHFNIMPLRLVDTCVPGGTTGGHFGHP